MVNSHTQIQKRRGIVMASPKISREEVVYEDAYRQLFRVVADFGDIKKEYVVTEAGTRAAIVVVKGKSVLLVRQYRLLINGLSWEIPGGKVNVGEDPEQAAVRECLEETGMRCSDLQHLLTFQPGLDTFHNPTHLFHSTNVLDTGEKITDPYERTSHEWVPFERCIEMIFENQIADSLSIVALLSYQIAGLNK
jgi:ADP-ribose pyrophosphatase